MNRPESVSAITPRALNVVRGVLFGGVLVAGGVGWYAYTRLDVALTSEELEILRFIMAGLLALAAVALFLMRRAQAQRTSYNVRASLAIAGWAVAESVGLFGAVLLILSGNILYYVIGVAFMLVAFVVIPVPREEGVQ